ncbi:hypothetical protein GDO78_017268 [Eleutherodactylus coqui]|uniref:Uncharacterized protein n=1 Tax=Eleutherodactylus coqui TaxID=57060 RepID=A0A8J6EKK5_ELECQ|nr:hypothetical protein GDO78_017268 [Eleutherodactylus coqui]
MTALSAPHLTPVAAVSPTYLSHFSINFSTCLHWSGEDNRCIACVCRLAVVGPWGDGYSSEPPPLLPWCHYTLLTKSFEPQFWPLLS